MEGHYAESQQFEERLEEEGSVSRSSREAGPAEASNFGAHSPRPARSQISTAVSFEPVHPANSAANVAQSGEDSAASAAEPEGELSSLPQEPVQGQGQQRQSRVAFAYPSRSLISTAVRPSAHAARQPHSPPAEQATSVVSKTALRRSPEAVRAGTPASVYAQDRAPGRRPLHASPHDSQAMEQDSNEGRAGHAAWQAIHHPAGSTAAGAHADHPQHSEWQEASVRHYDSAASQPPDSHASRPVPELQQNSQEGMQEGLSAEGWNNSIEAVQQGDQFLDDMAPAASVARSAPGAALEQQLAGLPNTYQAAFAAMAEGTALERSASAGSERNADVRSHGHEGPLGMLAAALEQSLGQPPRARPSTGQSSWVSGQGNAGQAAASIPASASAAQAVQGFNVPALPANSPFLSLASRYPAVLDVVMRPNDGLAAPVLRQELANAASGRWPAAQHSQGGQAERVASTRLPFRAPGTSKEGTPPPPNGGSNEPSKMPCAGGSNEKCASQQSIEDSLQQRLYAAGSLAHPAEGELQDPNLGQARQSAGSPPLEELVCTEPQLRQLNFAQPAHSGQQTVRAVAGQEAHSGAAVQGRPAGDFLHGADSGAMPALSIIRGLSGPVPIGALPGHTSSIQRQMRIAAEGTPALHALDDQAQGMHGAPQQENSLAHSLAAQAAGRGGQSQHEPAETNQPAPVNTAHAPASVHATVMSDEEEAISEGETHLSSRQAPASRSVPARSAPDAGPYVGERQASHHNAGLAQEEHARDVVVSPVRQEPAQPVDSTTAMAAPVAPTASCEQSVEMCPHGSPSAEAVAQDFDNSADSSPARALARDPRTSSRDAGQGGDVAPARLHRTGGLGVRMENGGRSLPDGVPSLQDRPEKNEREAYDAGPQNSNGTTMGQVLTAGPQSAQPEGSLGSHAAVEQLRPLADKETSPAAGEPAQRAMPAASANVGTSLPMGTPPLHPAARLGSSSLRNRPSLPPFAAGLVHTSKSAAAAPQNGIVLQQNGEHEPLRYTGSSPLQLPPIRSPHQAVAHEGLSIPDADHPGTMSGGRPAHATVIAGAQSARGSPVPRHELQSQRMSCTDSHQDIAPQPALTVIMPSGCLPHVSEGRGESQPAAHSPEFQSHNLRSTAPPNGLPQTGAGRSNAQENQAQSARSGAHRAYSNGHVAQTEGVLVVHDVLSGEDSAPDIGRAVTSPAPGSTPGRRRSIGKRKRVDGGTVDQPRSRYSATQCS